MDKTGAAQQRHLLRSQPKSPTSFFGQLCDSYRVAESERGLQIYEVCDGSKRAVELLGRQLHGQRRFGGYDSLPSGNFLKAAEDVGGSRAQDACQMQIELLACSSAG